MGLGRYLAIRGVNLVIVILGLVFLNFFLFRIIGDPVGLLTQNPRILPLQRELLRKQLGLDLPVQQQLLIYLGQLSRGDLGDSWFYHQPVIHEIWIRLPNTLLLLGTAHLVATLLGIVTGVKAAGSRGRRSDVGIVTSSLFVSSLPVFWIGFLLITFFSVYLPTIGSPVSLPIGLTMNPYWTGAALKANFLGYVFDVLKHMIMPVTALTIILFGTYTLILRNTLIDVLAEDYIITARAKGVSESDVLYKHALRNAYLPIITTLALNFGGILGGAILTETVFNWFGLGTLIIQSLGARDWPLLQGIFLMIGIMTVLANLVSDILYGVFDPRVRVS